MSENITLILDFDSTIVQVETLDELAKIALSARSSSEKDSVVSQIEALTNAGMEGSLSIEESLKQRILLLEANKEHVRTLTSFLTTQISPSFVSHKDFFSQNKDNIYIVSAGFTECIIPVALHLGLNPENIFANSFLYDPKTDKVIGIDQSKPLAKTKGKIAAVKSLHVPSSRIHALGDGYTDYEIKSEGAAAYFFAYTETVAREKVIKKADFIVGHFGEYLEKRALISNV